MKFYWSGWSWWNKWRVVQHWRYLYFDLGPAMVRLSIRRKR